MKCKQLYVIFCICECANNNKYLFFHDLIVKCIKIPVKYCENSERYAQMSELISVALSKQLDEKGFFY